MRWEIRAANEEAVARLTRELSVSSLVARLLVLRESPSLSRRTDS